MNETSAHVRFDLESRAENVALIRSAVYALGQVEGLRQEQVADIQTAVSEACNNVIVHAYGDDPGPMIVTLEASDEIVNVSVRDYGSGFTHIGNNPDTMGLGLAVMSALADRFQVVTPDEGIEVRMCFSSAGQEAGGGGKAVDGWLEQAPVALSGDTVVWLQPASLLAPVFGRILRAYAAVSRFTADRADELAEVGAALSDFAAEAGDGNAVGVSMAAGTHRLGLVSGPFPNAGSGKGQVQPQARLAPLVEELDLSLHDGQTMLSFTLSDRPAAHSGLGVPPTSAA